MEDTESERGGASSSEMGFTQNSSKCLPSQDGGGDGETDGDEDNGEEDAAARTLEPERHGGELAAEAAPHPRRPYSPVTV